jgi:DNA mismatch repair protein MutS
MRQYAEAKSAHPEAILMFRMGDFYEMFFEDAALAARELDLVLTSRDRDKGEDAVPMAGVPHHAVGTYVARLIEKGFSVALCDQVEDPKKARGLVRREIIRVITPGTVSDLEALDPTSASYLACAGPSGKDSRVSFLAMLELLSGEILYTECDEEQLGDEMRRMGVREVLVTPTWAPRMAKLLGDRPLPVRTVEESSSEDADTALLRDRFGAERIEGANSVAAQAIARLVRFAEGTQRRTLKHLMRPRVYKLTDTLVLDESTRRNLELVATQMDNRRQGSLLWHLDRCHTAMGSRALMHWLLFPLRDIQAIEQRLDAVDGLKSERPLRDSIQRHLDGVRDIERLLGRLCVGNVTPRDLGALRQSLAQIPLLKGHLASAATYLGGRFKAVDVAGDLHDLLAAALVDDPPMVASEGGIFRRGYRPELDEWIALATEGHDFLLDLERRERERTGIGSLKVRYNKIFGYYIEVTKANLDQIPPDYVRKQTLVGAERFITDELKKFEDKVTHADEQRKAMESAMFAELTDAVAEHTSRLRANIRKIL